MISPGGITASIPVTQLPVTPYLKACGPACVAGDVAADLRDLGRAGIGREAQTVLSCETLDVAGGDAGLDVHAPEQRVELPHLVQPLEADHDAALDRDRATGEAGAAASSRQAGCRARSTSAAPPRPPRPSTGRRRRRPLPTTPRPIRSVRYRPCGSASDSGATTSARLMRVSVLWRSKAFPTL